MSTPTGELGRLKQKTPLHAIELELRENYDLSRIEARALALRVERLVAEREESGQGYGQITYQAIASHLV